METAGWINDLNEWIQANPNWTGVLIFLFAFAESILLVGIIFPGAAFLVSLGALIGLGVLDFYTAWFWASLGGFLGDGISFWIGHKYKQNLLKMWPIYKFPDLIEKGQAFFQKYGGISVFIGRFVGPVRPIIPAIGGMMGMSVKKYVIISLVASVLWAPFYLLPGMLFGSAMESMAKVAVKLAVLVLVLVVLVWVAYWMISLIYRLLVPRMYRWLSALLAWTQRHPALGKLTSGLVDPRQPESGSLAMLAALLLVFLVAAIVFVANSATLNEWNQSTEAFFNAFHNPWTVLPMKWLLYLGHDLSVCVVTLTVSLWLVYRRLHLVLVHWLLLSISAYVFAVLINRFDAGEWNFWSTDHVFWFTAVASFWAILVAGAYPRLFRSWPYVVSGVLIVLYAFATLFFFQSHLGVVVLSILSASVWSMLVGIAFRTRNRKQFLGLPVKIIFLSTVLLMPVVSWWLFDTKDLVEKPQWLQQQKATKATGWANAGTQDLDLRIVAELPVLEQHLQSAGWRSHEPRTWGNVYQALQVDQDAPDLPLFSYVHQGDVEYLLMSTEVDGDLYALRVWPETSGQNDQWRASITRHRRDTDLKLFHHWGYEDAPKDKSVLINALKGAHFATDQGPSGDWLITQKRK